MSGPGFAVLRFRRVPLKPDGTPQRNAFEVDVEVGGAVHELRIRRLSGAVKVPPALHGDPLVPAIKAAAVAFVVAAALAAYGSRLNAPADFGPGT
jgi:hypothetical protein